MLLCEVLVWFVLYLCGVCMFVYGVCGVCVSIVK